MLLMLSDNDKGLFTSVMFVNTVYKLFLFMIKKNISIDMPNSIMFRSKLYS